VHWFINVTLLDTFDESAYRAWNTAIDDAFAVVQNPMEDPIKVAILKIKTKGAMRESLKALAVDATFDHHNAHMEKVSLPQETAMNQRVIKELMTYVPAASDTTTHHD